MFLTPTFAIYNSELMDSLSRAKIVLSDINNFTYRTHKWSYVVLFSPYFQYDKYHDTDQGTR